MSSRRTRKNSRRSNSRSGSRSRSRTRTQKQLDPLSQIFGPPPKKGYLDPIESAKRLAKKAVDLIENGPEVQKPTGNKKLKKLNPDKRRKLKGIQVKERIKDRKKKRELSQQNNKLIKEVEEANAQFKKIQSQFNPTRPSQPRKTQKSRPGRKRTIVPKPPSKSQSKTQKSRPTARTTRKIPQRPSQKKSQGTRPTKSFVTEGNRRTSKRLKDKRLKEKKKRNFLDKIKTTLKTQINNMDEPFKAAKGRTRNPPNRLTYTK